MRDAIDTLGQALEDVWDNLFLGAACSLLWLLLTLLVLPAPGATLAWIELAQRIHARESPDTREYLRMVWRHMGTGWRWTAIAAPVVLVLAADIRLADALFAPWLATAMQIAASVALALWLVVLAYSLPLLFQQERSGVLLAIRNGSVMALRNPVYSLFLLFVSLLFLWVSLLLIIVNLLAGPAFCAFLATRAVESRLRLWRSEQALSSNLVSPRE